MELLFYFLFVVLGVIIEASNVSEGRKWVDILERSKKNELDDDETRLVVLRSCLGMIYMFLSFVGLFTSQWPFFLALFILTCIMLVLKPIDRKLYWLITLDGVISIGLILMIVLNKYHNIFF